MTTTLRHHRTLVLQLPDDGRLLLHLSAFALVLSGLFALVLGVTGRFLPHDERYLGMTAAELCALHGCRIVHFMVHDRVSFGGALIAVGVLYSWLTEQTVRHGQAWAWWALALSSVIGFASFFAYLGYGYLDTWHGLATLALLPCFVIGLVQSWCRHPCLPSIEDRQRCLHHNIGKAFLLATAAGMVVGGLTIFTVGATCVFVPQDLAFMGLSVEELHSLNPRLVPLIAHDRAGFGGGVCCAGLAMFFCVWYGAPSRGLWLVLAFVGIAGFGAGIGAHPAVGYHDPLHLAPAVIGALTYAIGLALTCRSMFAASRPVPL